MMNLDLRAPLIYEKVRELPEKFNENAEYLICYELDLNQASDIEPNTELLLEREIFIGKKADKLPENSKEIVELSAGLYLFTQCTGLLSRDEWLELAVEQQKDGLWERNTLKNTLYIRFLYEDGNYVTQIFRSIGS